MVGAENDFCEENGQCKCKEHFGGEKCNQCSNSHLPYPACIPGKPIFCTILESF